MEFPQQGEESAMWFKTITLSAAAAIVPLHGVQAEEPGRAKDAKVCISDTATGTRLSKRVCKSLSDWKAELSADAFAQLEKEIARRSSRSNAGGARL
jgi:hypothetical protein